MTVDEIKKIQRQLKAWGFDPGPIDGKFDAKTKKAVMDFQGSKGLSKDGNVGPQTLAALNKQQCQRRNPWERPECRGGSN
ncbi:MAG: peptidoglycan-binding protein [Pseudanabaenales cyanobacterium]|nr:peptidoglycan-binding protein [Pseudanabaenales cyanobacterium]